MDCLVTFLEGIVTFVSPCLLPMLPLYLAYFAGGRGDDEGRLRHTVVCALCFVVGFAAVFMLLGVFAGTLGSLLVRHRRVLDLVCGAFMALLGLGYLGILRIPALDRTVRLSAVAPPRAPASSLAFGIVFAVGWSPCVGTFLASALSLAASSASAMRGLGLLACYSVGLGLPFVLAAVAIDRLEGAFRLIRERQRLIDGICGSLLVAMGLLMATGILGLATSALAA